MPKRNSPNWLACALPSRAKGPPERNCPSTRILAPAIGAPCAVVTLPVDTTPLPYGTAIAAPGLETRCLRAHRLDRAPALLWIRRTRLRLPFTQIAFVPA